MANKHFISPDTFIRTITEVGLFLPFQYTVEISGVRSLVDDLSREGVVDSSKLPSSIRSSPTLGLQDSGTGDVLNFQTVEARIPNTGIDTETYVAINDSGTKMPLKLTRGDMALMMRSSGDLREYAFFYAWREFIANQYTVRYMNAYARNINVILWRNNPTDPEKPTKLFTVSLIDAYPSAVGQVELKQDSGQADYVKFLVDFNYRAIKTSFAPGAVKSLFGN